MTLSSTLALALALFVLAVIPGAGVLIVVSRSISHGFHAGITTSIGTVVGDYVYIFFALFGLAALAQTHAELFIFVRYLGAAYLFYLAFSLITNPKSFGDNATDKSKTSALSKSLKINTAHIDSSKIDISKINPSWTKKVGLPSTSHIARKRAPHLHFLAGFLVTMGNPKAVLFYVSFLPAFIDLAALSALDILVLYGCTTIVIGGVMLAYAYVAAKGARLMNGRRDRVLRYGSSAVLVASSVYLLATV